MKKLRRLGIGGLTAGNAYLATTYWAEHNARFTCAAASTEDFHLPAPSRRRLDAVFRLQTTRSVSNDWVVRYDNRFFQLERQSGLAPARSTVVVFEDQAGSVEIQYRGRPMRWTALAVPAGGHALPRRFRRPRSG